MKRRMAGGSGLWWVAVARRRNGRVWLQEGAAGRTRRRRKERWSLRRLRRRTCIIRHVLQRPTVKCCNILRQIHGVHCSPTIQFKTTEYFMKTGRSSLRLQEVQELALHCVLGSACLPCPRWAFLAHQVADDEGT
jgi:hypothetical protein